MPERHPHRRQQPNHRPTTEMKDKIFITVVGLLAAIMFLIIGVTIGQSKEHERAVQAGVGHWEANPTNGNLSFIYSK